MEEKRKKCWARRTIAVISGILFAFLLEGMISVYQINRGYGENETAFALVPVLGNDYTVGEDGKLWQKTGPLPWALFHPGREIGHIRIRFQKPLTEDTNIQCYYGVNDSFHPLQCKSRYLLKGTTDAVFTVPYGRWNSYRLSIDGSFVLEDMEAVETVPFRTIRPAQIVRHADKVRLIVFLLLFGVSGVLSAGQKEKGVRANDRLVFFDAVRVLAALMVIITHVAAPMERIFVINRSNGEYPAFLFCQFVTMSCNPLFFMLSGALLLPWREEKLSVFLQKRLMKVLLPLLVYGGIYLIFLCASRVPLKAWAAAYVLPMLAGNVRMGPHLWMVFELIGMYILVPPFRALFRHASEQTEKRLAAFILGLTGISSAAYYAHLELGVSTFLSEWTGVFLLGYLMNREWMRRYDRYWMLGGAAALAAGIVLSAERGGYGEYVFGTSILVQLIACGIFAAVLRMEKYLRRIKGVLLFFSKYSYSVLLIHWYVLYHIVFIRGLSPYMPKTLYMLAAAAACTVLSLIFCMIIDHTVIAVLEQAIRKLPGWIHTSRFLPYYKYRE